MEKHHKAIQSKLKKMIIKRGWLLIKIRKLECNRSSTHPFCKTVAISSLTPSGSDMNVVLLRRRLWRWLSTLLRKLSWTAFSFTYGTLTLVAPCCLNPFPITTTTTLLLHKSQYPKTFIFNTNKTLPITNKKTDPIFFYIVMQPIQFYLFFFF